MQTAAHIVLPQPDAIPSRVLRVVRDPDLSLDAFVRKRAVNSGGAL